MNISLLQRLRDAEGAFLLPDDLGASWQAIRRDLDELEAFGFAIEQHPYRGIAYHGPAERLCPDQIEHELNTRRVGCRVAVWNCVTSTNDLAARAATSPANEGLVILAEEQTAGRGSRGRVWTAPPRSSILLSTLLFPPAEQASSAWLTALGAVATAEVVTNWTGREASIKWPNDVRVGGRKIAGVLVERGLGAVIGIGLNANITIDELPSELRPTATSLQDLLGHRVDRSELARALICRLDDHYEEVRQQGAESLNHSWIQRIEYQHWIVRVTTRDGSHLGRLVAIDLQHGLMLEQDDGQHQRIAIPEIVAIDAVQPAAVPD